MSFPSFLRRKRSISALLAEKQAPKEKADQEDAFRPAERFQKIVIRTQIKPTYADVQCEFLNCILCNEEKLLHQSVSLLITQVSIFTPNESSNKSCRIFSQGICSLIFTLLMEEEWFNMSFLDDGEKIEESNLKYCQKIVDSRSKYPKNVLSSDIEVI